MYTCIIVDDLKEAVDLIKDHVLKIPQLSILLSTTDAIAALAFLCDNKPDIIFLDIEMPYLTGIEFVENLKAKWGNNMPKVVFTTGHPDYAISGYEHGVFDYILKPITFARLKKCTDRIIDELDKRNNTDKDFFFAEDEGKKIKINFDDIVFVKAEGNYVGLVSNEYRITIYKSMNTMQVQLPCDKFIRVHKSFIVSIAKMQAVNGNDIMLKFNNEIISIPIGLTYKENVLRQLGIS